MYDQNPRHPMHLPREMQANPTTVPHASTPQAPQEARRATPTPRRLVGFSIERDVWRDPSRPLGALTARGSLGWVAVYRTSTTSPGDVPTSDDVGPYVIQAWSDTYLTGLRETLYLSVSSWRTVATFAHLAYAFVSGVDES